MRPSAEKVGKWKFWPAYLRQSYPCSDGFVETKGRHVFAVKFPKIIIDPCDVKNGVRQLGGSPTQCRRVAVKLQRPPQGRDVRERHVPVWSPEVDVSSQGLV